MNSRKIWNEKMSASTVYVSITGLRLKGRRHSLRFWWHAISSMIQARQAPGNVKAETRTIDGIHHTLSAWTDENAMRHFLGSGAHRNAMKAFHSIATGRTLGFYAPEIPDWDTGLQRWHREARKV